MRINGGGSPNVNLLLSDTAQFRNEDFVVSENGAFKGTQGFTSEVGEFAHEQIFNPVGSGITLLVDKILVSSTVDDNFGVAAFNTELTTDGGAWISALLGGAAGACHLRRESNVGLLGTLIEQEWLLAHTSWNDALIYPYQLDPGEGLLVRAGSTNQNLITTFYGREV